MASSVKWSQVLIPCLAFKASYQPWTISSKLIMIPLTLGLRYTTF